MAAQEVLAATAVEVVTVVVLENVVKHAEGDVLLVVVYVVVVA